MFYIITPNKIYKGKTLKEINRSIHGMMELDEFHPLGNDFIANLTFDDIDFIQDKRRSVSYTHLFLIRQFRVKLFLHIDPYLLRALQFRSADSGDLLKQKVRFFRL